MDNFDKNQVDKDLLEKVDEVLNGKHIEDAPELVFSEEIPKDYDISQDLNAGVSESVEGANAVASGGFEPEVEVPDAGFNYNAPEAPNFGGFVQNGSEQEGWNGTVQQGGETWQELKDKRKPNKKGDGVFEDGTKAIIGFVIGVLAIAVSFMGFALGIFPIILGLFFSKSGLNSNRRTLAMAGLIMNIIGAVLFVFAVIKGISL